MSRTAAGASAVSGGGGRRAAQSAARIAAEIEQEIVTGALEAGARLSEVGLARRFGVGRAPVREALRTLEGRRLVTRTPNAGPRVVALSARDVEQLLQMREVLEGLSARLAAERIALADLNRLETLLSSESRIESEGVGAVFGAGSNDNDFHSVLAGSGGNEWLMQTLTRDLYALLRVVRFRAASFGDRARAAHAEHCAILEAVRLRDPDRAEALMRLHIQRSRETLRVAE